MERAVALLLGVAACHSLGQAGTASTDAGGGGDAITADAAGSNCAPAVCGSDSCGSGVDACGNPISCAVCRYDATVIATATGLPALALGTGAAPAVSVAVGGVLASRGATGAWTSQQLVDGNTPINAIADIAFAPDGTGWAVYDAGGMTRVGSGSAGSAAWTFQSLAVAPAIANSERIAITPDGHVAIAFAGGAASLAQGGIVLATTTGAAAWSFTLVASTSANHVALALDPAGGGSGVAIAWQTPNQVAYTTATPAGASGAIEIVDANAAAQLGDELGLAFDAAGRAHVAYLHDVALDRVLDHAVRDAGTWTIDRITPVVGGSSSLHVAADAGGALAIVWTDEDLLSIAQPTSGAWLIQPLDPSCEAGGAVGFIGGQLELVKSCGVSAIELSRDGVYPAGYNAACVMAADALCTAACGCDASCCFDDSTGNRCDNPIGTCQTAIELALCGDPTRDPAQIAACSAALSSLTCNTDQALATPTSCTFE